MQLPRLFEAVDAAVDDYYSPIKPEHYIELRLMPAIDFYQKRVPTKTHQRLVFKLTLLTAAVASAFFARYELPQWVTIVIAWMILLLRLIMSYPGFADAECKVER